MNINRKHILTYAHYEYSLYRKIKEYADNNNILMSDNFKAGIVGRNNQLLLWDGCIYFASGFSPSVTVKYACNYMVFFE